VLGQDDFGELLEGVLAHAEGALRYVLRGEIDESNAGLLLKRLASLCDTQASRVELDMADVTFIGSAGLKTLVLARGAARDKGLDLDLMRPSPLVRRVITIAQLEDELLGRDERERGAERH
jgi:anti-sigma B factor antagonist